MPYVPVLCSYVHVFLIYLKAEGRSEAGTEKGQKLERAERERRIEEKRREQKEAEAVTRLVSEEQRVEEKRREQRLKEKQEAEAVTRLVRDEQRGEEKRREQKMQEKQAAEAVTRLVREEQIIEEKRREQRMSEKQEAEAVTRLVREEQIIEQKRSEQRMQEKQEPEAATRPVREQQIIEEKRREQKVKENQEAEAATRLVREEQRVYERLLSRRPQEAQEVKTGPILAADKNRNEEWRLREKQGIEAIKRLDGEEPRIEGKLREKQDAEAAARLDQGRQTNLQDKKEPAKLQSLQGAKEAESTREAVQPEKPVLKASPAVPAQETQGFKTISGGQTVRPLAKEYADNANRSGEKKPGLNLSFGLQDDSSFVKTEETNAKMLQDKNMDIRTSIDQNNNVKKNIDQNQNIKKRQDQNYNNNVKAQEDDTNNAKKFKSQNNDESKLQQEAENKNINIGTSHDRSSNARASPDQQSSTKTSQYQHSDIKAAQDQKLTRMSQKERGGDQLIDVGALTNDQREKNTSREVASNLDQKEHRKRLEADKTQNKEGKEFSLGRNDTKSKIQPTETAFSKSENKEDLNTTLAEIIQENNKTLQIAPKTHQGDDQASWSGKMKENPHQPSAAPFRHVSRQVN